MASTTSRATAGRHLALDLMEPFRPLIADSAVLQAINNAEVQARLLGRWLLGEIPEYPQFVTR